MYFKEFSDFLLKNINLASDKSHANASVEWVIMQAIVCFYNKKNFTTFTLFQFFLAKKQNSKRIFISRKMENSAFGCGLGKPVEPMKVLRFQIILFL